MFNDFFQKDDIRDVEVLIKSLELTDIQKENLKELLELAVNYGKIIYLEDTK